MALSNVAKVMWIIILLVNSAGLAIAIAGVAKLTDMCRKNDSAWAKYASVLGDLIQNPDQNRKYDCGIHFSLSWWIVIGHGALLVYGFLATFVTAVRAKLTMLHLLAVSTTLFCVFASRYVQAQYTVMGNSDDFMRGCAAASAGSVVVLTMNFVWAFLTSSDQ